MYIYREEMWLPCGNYQYYLIDHPPKVGQALGNMHLVVNTIGTGGTVFSNRLFLIIFLSPEAATLPPVKNQLGDVPGPPVQYGSAVDPDDVAPGYGFSQLLPLREDECYYYHSDHLGSTSYITDTQGNASQFVCYMPFGEAFVDEHNTRPGMPYKFNGKEQDAETGLYYYGARYYDPKECRFYGVDPMAEKYPNMGAFVYCNSNPVRLIDPTGMDWYQSLDGEGNVVKDSQPIYFKGSEQHDGYGNIGAKTLSIDNEGNQRSFNVDGSITNSILLGNVNIVGDKRPSGQGGNTLNAVGTGVGLLGLSSDIAKESGYVTTIGTNLKPYASGWTGNQFVKTIGIAKGVGTVTFVAGGLIDGALYFMKNPETGQSYQSGAKTLTNIGVSGTAMYLGGIPGIILGGGYMLNDKTVGWDRVMTPASNDQWVPNRAVFPDGTTIYVCFKAGTQILVKEGLKPIERVVVGDSVYSYNLDKNIIELSKVVKSFERKTQEIYELTTDNQKLYVTAEHPFYVEGKGWVKVKNLQPGIVLKTKGSSNEHVTSVVIEKHPETVYNIEVEGNHNYFVTNSNILVHNK